MAPGIGGCAVCRQPKANPDARAIPIIFIAAMNETEDEGHGPALGAVDHPSTTSQADQPGHRPRARVRPRLASYDQNREPARLVHERTISKQHRPLPATA